MSPFWKLVGDAVPATWGMEGFIRINSNGATVGEQHTPYIMLWVLTGVYFAATYILRRINFKGGRLKSVPSTPKIKLLSLTLHRYG